MLYCTKCQTAFEEGTTKCPNCSSERSIRVADDLDYVLLHKADLYTARRLAEDFEANGVAYRMEDFAGKRISYLYDSEVMPTDQNIYVLYQDLEKAKKCSARIKANMQEQETETFDEMSPKKRIIVQIISVVLFLILVTAVVLGADYIAEWLKGLFQS